MVQRRSRGGDEEDEGETLTELAEFSFPAVWTEALERTDPVDAGTSVLTWAVRTVIDICVRDI